MDAAVLNEFRQAEEWAAVGNIGRILPSAYTSILFGIFLQIIPREQLSDELERNQAHFTSVPSLSLFFAASP